MICQTMEKPVRTTVSNEKIILSLDWDSNPQSLPAMMVKVLNLITVLRIGWKENVQVLVTINIHAF